MSGIAFSVGLMLLTLGGLLPQSVLASSAGGTIVAWGDNSYGERDIPAGLTDPKAVSAGGFHALALGTDGAVVAWGGDIGGDTHVPAGLTGVVAISAGTNSSLALRGDGTVIGWGDSVPPTDLTHVTAISAGIDFSLAMEAGGTIVAWGTANMRTNVPGAVAASAGGDGLVLKGDGTVAVLVGDPTKVPAGLTDVVAISAGGNHDLALKRDGTVVAWGADSHGQIDIPPGLSDVVAIEAGTDFSLALTRGGMVVGWGDNRVGQAVAPEGMSGVTTVSAGGFSLALVGPGGSTGGVVRWRIVLAAAIPLGFIGLGVLAWFRRRDLVARLLGRIPIRTLPTVLAVALALISLPLVAATLDATDPIGNLLPATSFGQWTAAASAVLMSAFVAGTIGGRIMRVSPVLGGGVTFLVALVVAIPATPLLPLLLGQNVAVGNFCLDSCGPVASTANLGGGLYAALYFWLAPFVEPVPVLSLAVGTTIWTITIEVLVRRNKVAAADDSVPNAGGTEVIRWQDSSELRQP